MISGGLSGGFAITSQAAVSTDFSDIAYNPGNYRIYSYLRSLIYCIAKITTRVYGLISEKIAAFQISLIFPFMKYITVSQ